MAAFSNNNITLKTNATKAKKPRRELPEDLTDFYIADGECPSALDVIAGRGYCSNQHEGNKRYWHLILAERSGYKKLGKNNKTEKNEIAQGIYDYILSTGGRFLQLDRETHKWFNLPEKIGLEKIKQALRDKYVPNFLEEEQLPSMAVPLLIPSAPCEGNKKQFLAFLDQQEAPVHSLDNQGNRKSCSGSKRKRKDEVNKHDDDLDAFVASNQFVSKRMRTLSGAIKTYEKAMGDLELELLMSRVNSEILNELKKETFLVARVPVLSQ